MKKRLFKRFNLAFIGFLFAFSVPAKADFFGGDLPLLAQIAATALTQLTQLKSILKSGNDTLGLLQDINHGIKEAMGMIRTMNHTMQPGALGHFQDVTEALRAIQELYGGVPNTADAKLEQLNDQSVAEAVTLHNQAFQYAAEVDPEAERIKDYSKGVSPTGAGRLTAQSLGVLIHVSNQILRTNAAMLKLLGENLALQNRREKVNSQQFKMQYEGLSSGLGNFQPLKKSTDLNRSAK